MKPDPDDPDAIDVIKAVMASRQLSQRAAAVLWGMHQSKLNIILSRRQPLNIHYVRLFHAKLNLPLDLLIMETRDRNGEFWLDRRRENAGRYNHKTGLFEGGILGAKNESDR